MLMPDKENEGIWVDHHIRWKKPKGGFVFGSGYFWYDEGQPKGPYRTPEKAQAARKEQNVDVRQNYCPHCGHKL